MQLDYLLSALLLLLVAAYFFLFKKFFSEFGKQTAQLTTLAERTRIIEQVREQFTSNLEIAKAALSRKNIAFQIRQSEFARLQFERLDQLYAKLYELQKYSRSNLFAYGGEEQFRENKQQFLSLYHQAKDAFYLSVLYLDDDIANAALDLLNECDAAYGAFTDFYYSDQNRTIFAALPPSESLHNKNIASFERFKNSIDKFPKLLTEIRARVQTSLGNDNGG